MKSMRGHTRRMDENLSVMKKLVKDIKSCMDCSEHSCPFVRDMCSEGPWFYPPKGEVQGFFGTGKTMFVAEGPSPRGKFPSKADKYFYCLLEKHGFADAHLTDLVKCRELSRDFEKCKRHLRKEIKILKPELIVAVGRKAHEQLKKLDVNAEYMMHYSHAVRFKKKPELEAQFRDLCTRTTLN